MRTLVLRKASGALTSRHHAICVVTRYRVLWLKRSSKGVYKSESLLELASITMVDSGKVPYTWRWRCCVERAYLTMSVVAAHRSAGPC